MVDHLVTVGDDFKLPPTVVAAMNFPQLARNAARETQGSAIVVNDGYVPPNGELWDGAIVKERTSGRIWIAEKNDTVTGYNRKWIRWPYLFTGYTNYPLGDNSEALFGWQNFSPDPNRYCLNALPSDIVGTFWVCPMKGIWNLDVRCVFHTPGFGGGYRQSRIAINGLTENFSAGRSEDVNSLSMANYAVGSNGVCTTHSQIQTIVSKGETVVSRLFQNSGTQASVTAVFKATMMEPIS